MFRTVFKSTFRTTLRSPVTILSFAALMFYLIISIENISVPAEDIMREYHYFTYNSVCASLKTVIPVFLCVIACVDIMRDKRNKFFDVTKSTGINIFKYFTAKLCVYLIAAYIVTAIIAYSEVAYAGINQGYLGEIISKGVIWDVFLRIMVLTTPVAFIYISGSLFLTLYTQNSAFGIVAGIIYTLIQWMFISLRIDTFFGNYIYSIPGKIENYMYYLGVPELSPNITPFSEVLLSFGIITGITLAFLTADYFRLCKMKD